MADFFEVQLCILVVFCAIALLFERYGLRAEDEASATGTRGKDEDDEIHLGGLSKASNMLGMRYLGIYAVVMGQSESRCTPVSVRLECSSIPY